MVIKIEQEVIQVPIHSLGHVVLPPPFDTLVYQL